MGKNLKSGLSDANMCILSPLLSKPDGEHSATFWKVESRCTHDLPNYISCYFHFGLSCFELGFYLVQVKELSWTPWIYMWMLLHAFLPNSNPSKWFNSIYIWKSVIEIWVGGKKSSFNFLQQASVTFMIFFSVKTVSFRNKICIYS